MKSFAMALMLLASAAAPVLASDDDCSAVNGDVALAARTPQVDLFTDSAGTQKAMTVDAGKFPACTPITGRSPNMMLQIDMSGTKYWVPPHMVKYRFAGKLPAICRNLALGSNQEKAGATRGLGEGCPKGAH
ncbi:MAG TPA: hypothetical protein VG867_11620 [Rhizomicrobium sp.]|nr:hypothetical protein [Rhizomicrobium sp.]